MRLLVHLFSVSLVDRCSATMQSRLRASVCPREPRWRADSPSNILSFCFASSFPCVHVGGWGSWKPCPPCIYGCCMHREYHLAWLRLRLHFHKKMKVGPTRTGWGWSSPVPGPSCTTSITCHRLLRHLIEEATPWWEFHEAMEPCYIASSKATLNCDLQYMVSTYPVLLTI